MLKINNLSNKKNIYKPLISIIITNYKNEFFLKKTLDSCIKQTYNNIEIIVINDASLEDKCYKIISKFSDKRIFLYSTSINYGTYACRNFGIDSSNGEYITFLDADDWIDKRHIEDLFSALIEYNLIGVCSLYNRYDEHGRKIKGPCLCEASLLFDRNKVLKSLGYYHMVRCGADSEFRERMIKIHGENKVGLLMRTSYFALQKSDSLTKNPLTGKNSHARNQYINSYLKLHTTNNNLFYDYKNTKLNFKINNLLAVNNFNVINYKKII